MRYQNCQGCRFFTRLARVPTTISAPRMPSDRSLVDINCKQTLLPSYQIILWPQMPSEPHWSTGTSTQALQVLYFFPWNMELNSGPPCWQIKAQTKQPLPTLLRWMKVCCGYAFRRRFESRLLIWVLKRALCLKWQMPLWQRISQTLKVEVEFGSSVWSSFFSSEKGTFKEKFQYLTCSFPLCSSLANKETTNDNRGKEDKKSM